MAAVAYCTPAEVEAQISLTGGASASRVALIPQCIDDAEAWIDNICGRSFSKSPSETVEGRPDGADRRVFPAGDLVSAASVETREDRNSPWTALSANDWTLWRPWRRARLRTPVFPAQGVMLFADCPPFPSRPEPETTVRVTGVFGWASVPDPVRRACILRAAYLTLQLAGPGHSAGAFEPSAMPSMAGTMAEPLRMLAPYRRVVVA